MSQPSSGSAEEREAGDDDIVLGFRTVRSNIMGRLVRMGAVADEILNRHAYPLPVIEALGHAVVLSTLLGAPLKEGARLILQTKTDGPLRFLVTNYESPGQLRGYASFDEDRLTALGKSGKVGQGALLGSGLLAMTIDPGGDRDRYQGIVQMQGETLASAALTYFRQSEQLPTYLRLAVARQYVPGPGGGSWRWRAGGLLVQHLSPLGGTPPPPQDDEEERMLGEDDDNWQRVSMLASTVEDHELLDPTLTPDALLWRLFNEEGVIRAVDPMPLAGYCRCSHERVAALMASFSVDEMTGMREPDGRVAVTCEFCNTTYRFAPGETA
jgi:molecular chaperone Hsp33